MSYDVFPLVPHRVINTGVEYKVVVNEMENANEQRILRSTTPFYSFSLTFQIINTIGNANANVSTPLSIYSEYHNLPTILEFFAYQRGSYRAFNFHNHVDGQIYKVRFRSNSLSIDYVNKYLCNVTIELQTTIR